MSDLAADTAVRPGSAAGRYLAELPESWNFRFPSGGVLVTCALQAARAELADDSLRPVSATSVFVSPVPHGPLALEVKVLRRGRAAAQVQVQVAPPDAIEPGLELLAVFAREREGPDVFEAELPELPGPEESRPCDQPHDKNPHTRFPFFENYDVRLAVGDRWWLPEEFRAGPARHGRWWRYKTPQRGAGGTLDPLAIPPVADTMPAALIQRLGPDGPSFRAPSLDLTVHWLEETDDEWLLALSYVRRARGGLATAEIEIWSESRRLIAYGTQMMTLRRRNRA